MAEEPKSKKPFEEKDADKASAKAGSEGKQSKKTASENEPSVSEALTHLYDAVKPKVVRASRKAYGFASDAISSIMGSKKKNEEPAGDDQNKTQHTKGSDNVSKDKSDKATKPEKPSDQKVKSEKPKGGDSKDS
tara:strand:- start:236 stop:637 length:402 start_codon:yes stop_codon:yes gene_type:complete